MSDDQDDATRHHAEAAHRKARQPLPPEVWEHWDDEALLDLRLCDLDVRIERSPIAGAIAQLFDELEQRGLTFRPHFWVSDEWYCPDGIPGIAVPFYLTHPRLARLEERKMLEVEGGTHDWAMRILRHETGHAIDNAYDLRRRKRRRELFGSSSQEYPEFYTPRPYSKSYAINLSWWYGQSHPDEDFGETFAVWLTPGLDWRRRYEGWKALRKLEYVDGLMNGLRGVPPKVTSRARVDPLSRLRRTLRTHYDRRTEQYGVEDADVYDRDLRRLFSNRPEYADQPSAAKFIQRHRREARRRVRRWTGVFQYTIDRVLQDMIDRCRALNLRLATEEEEAHREFVILLTVQTMNYLHSGRNRLAL